MIAGKALLSAAVIAISGAVAIVPYLLLVSIEVHYIIANMSIIIFPSLALPLIWIKNRKKYFLCWLAGMAVYAAVIGTSYCMVRYNEKITVDTSPNINVTEYLPFEENSKIVKVNGSTLKLTENLPRIDGATALFPVYSAFVNAVYPETTKLNDGIFEYNNTVRGYMSLAEKQTDIFLGAYPSEEQREYAKECGTTFEYTPIGTEAFVFFVHKDNPIESLKAEQIRGIYSGEITNWKQVGGKNEKIQAFQRNEGSGSQSMLKRFMGDKPIAPAPSEKVNDLMSGIIERVEQYKSKPSSIGFSFRYYVESIIGNPNIKLLAVDGVKPSAENIKNGTYPIVTPVYAVTYKENTNENVKKLLEWILSDDGQYIIEETGYIGIAN